MYAIIIVHVNSLVEYICSNPAKTYLLHVINDFSFLFTNR